MEQLDRLVIPLDCFRVELDDVQVLSRNTLTLCDGRALGLEFLQPGENQLLGHGAALQRCHVTHDRRLNIGEPTLGSVPLAHDLLLVLAHSGSISVEVLGDQARVGELRP
jgi:hypothetical protein